MRHPLSPAVRRPFAACAVVFTLGCAPLLPAAAAPIFQIAASPVPSGQSLTVEVLASGLSDLYGYQFTLRFDPTRVRFTSATEGPFLARGGATFFDGGTADNAAGTVSFVFDTLVGAVPGVSGSGELARFAFATLRGGAATFSLTDLLAVDSTLATLAVGTAASPVVIPEPATLPLLALGVLSLAVAGARRRTRGASVSLAGRSAS